MAGRYSVGFSLCPGASISWTDIVIHRLKRNRRSHPCGDTRESQSKNPIKAVANSLNETQEDEEDRGTGQKSESRS
jgi:hypothetical protein